MSQFQKLLLHLLSGRSDHNISRRFLGARGATRPTNTRPFFQSSTPGDDCALDSLTALTTLAV